MGSLTTFSSWWLDGLTDAVAMRDARRSNRGRMRLTPSGNGAYVLETSNGQAGREPFRFVQDDTGALRAGPAQLVERCGGKPVDLVLGADEFLARTLDPLPAESKAYIDGIVLHNLERVTPWRSDDVLHAHTCTRMDAGAGSSGEGRLLVTLVATPRALVAPRIAALQAMGVASIRLVAPGADPGGGEAYVSVASPEAEALQRAALRRWVVRTLASAAAGAVLLLGGLTWALGNAESRREALSAEMARVRSGLLGASGARGSAHGEAVWAKKAESVPAVNVLEALSAALPDDTWLTELRYGEGRIRVVGISRNVTALVPLLEKVPGFSAPRFFAPTVRLPGTQGNQFHLEAQLVAAKAPGQRASAAVPGALAEGSDGGDLSHDRARAMTGLRP